MEPDPEYIFLAYDGPVIKWFYDIKNAILYSQKYKCKLERLHLLKDGTVNIMVLYNGSLTRSAASGPS